MGDSLTQTHLKEWLHYARETGVFTWRARPSNRVSIGAVAGSLSQARGYWTIYIGGRNYQAHRLAWLYVTGDWPVAQIDHVNGAREDNRFVNLREASPAENRQNTGLNRNNTSGFVGVSFDKAKGKWRATIWVGYVQQHLGRFDTPEAAYTAYLAAKAQHHTFNPVPRDLVVK